MKSIVQIIIINALIFNNISSYSQSTEELSTRDRIVFGGSFGLTLGTYNQIEISPNIGYRLSAPWIVGTGIIYQYYGSNSIYGSYSTSIYGLNLFTKYTLFRNFPSNGLSIFAYSGYEMLSLEKKYFSITTSDKGRFLLNSVLVGGGLRQFLGGRTSMEVQILFNLNQYQFSPYNNPTIRVAINF